VARGPRSGRRVRFRDVVRELETWLYYTPVEIARIQLSREMGAPRPQSAMEKARFHRIRTNVYRRIAKAGIKDRPDRLFKYDGGNRGAYLGYTLKRLFLPESEWPADDPHQRAIHFAEELGALTARARFRLVGEVALAPSFFRGGYRVSADEAGRLSIVWEEHSEQGAGAF